MIEWYDYFQIAALILISLLTTGRAIHLRITHHINPISIGRDKKLAHKTVEFSLFLALLLAAAVVLSCALHVEENLFPTFAKKQLFDWQFAKLIGAGLLTFSLIIFVLALISFGNSWRVGIDQKTPGELVSRGIFAVTRNPIFVSLIVYAIGTFLINGRLILLVFVVLIVAGVQYQIVQEEKFLQGRYGKAYEEYRARTGRYIRFRGWKRA